MTEKDPKLLAQLQGLDAEVLGSDGEKVGKLKSVGDADFLVDRKLKRDLHLPVSHVEEITADDKVILDVPAERAEDLNLDVDSGQTDPASRFSDNPDDIKRGPWEVTKND